MIHDWETSDHVITFLYCNPFDSKTGCVCSCLAQYFTVLVVLLHSEVIGCQASVVDVENQAGVVNGGIKHLEEVDESLFRLKIEN